MSHILRHIQVHAVYHVCGQFLTWKIKSYTSHNCTCLLHTSGYTHIFQMTLSIGTVLSLYHHLVVDVTLNLRNLKLSDMQHPSTFRRLNLYKLKWFPH